MLTTTDIAKLQKLFYTKDEIDERFYAKTEIDAKFDRVFEYFDLLLKETTKEEQEMIIMRYRMDRAEEWIGKASPKLGLNFKH